MKRFGLEAQQVRLNATLVLDWFRILLLNGWIGSHTHRNHNEPRECDGGQRLHVTHLSRRKHRLNRPYGRAAHLLGLVRTPNLPGKDPPDDDPPPEPPPMIDAGTPHERPF